MKLGTFRTFLKIEIETMESLIEDMESFKESNSDFIQGYNSATLSQYKLRLETMEKLLNKFDRIEL